MRNHRECICPRGPICCGGHAGCRTQTQPSHTHGHGRDPVSPTLSVQRLRADLPTTPPWLSSCLGRGRRHTVPPDLAAQCGANGGTWDWRTARESAMHIGGPEPKTRPPTTTSLPPIGPRSWSRRNRLFQQVSPRFFTPSRAPHVKPQLGHAGGALPCSVPCASFPFVELDF